MKRIVALLLLFGCSFALFAQTEQTRQEVDFYKQTLEIEEDQVDKLNEIIVKKYSDLDSISSLRSSDELKYRQKRRVIYRLAENSLRIILKEEQLGLWQKYKNEKRAQNASLIRELQGKNANKEDLKDAQYGIVN